MSVRRGASAPIVGRQASSRLDEVLRAGSKARTDADAEGSLTRTLKRTSLVPTGACLPRNFDPDYCAYDGYYAIGVGLVSATLGALVNARRPQLILAKVAYALRDTLGYYCHTPQPGWFDDDSWDSKADAYITENRNAYIPGYTYSTPKSDARQDFSALCTALDFGLASIQTPTQINSGDRLAKGFGSNRIGLGLMRFTMLLLGPMAAYDFEPSYGKRPTKYSMWNTIEEGNVSHGTAVGLTVAWAVAVTKYLSRYMNEHALMIASFFRVNAKRLHASEPLLTDIKAFARQCKEDIADGPGPAVPPPPPLTLPPEERDPLMDGIDYPPSIGASACK